MWYCDIFKGNCRSKWHQNDRCNDSVMGIGCLPLTLKTGGGDSYQCLRGHFTLPRLLASWLSFWAMKAPGIPEKNHYSCIPKNSMKSNRKPCFAPSFWKKLGFLCLVPYLLLRAKLYNTWTNEHVWIAANHKAQHCWVGTRFVAWGQEFSWISSSNQISE